jgi:hypothetical protein
MGAASAGCRQASSCFGRAKGAYYVNFFAEAHRTVGLLFL